MSLTVGTFDTMTTAVHPISERIVSDDLGEPAVLVADGQVTIEGLAVHDATVVQLIAAAPPAERAETVRRLLVVGASGLATMGVGLDIGSIDTRVRSTLEAVTDETERRVHELLEESRRTLREEFDPERRSSLMGRSLADFAAWRDEVLQRLDPDRPGNPTTDFLGHLTELVGDGGALERRLAEALDPETDGSALSRVATAIDDRFRELRELMIHRHGVEEGRADEAERGTAHGVDFEDVVEEHLRTWAAGVGGCTVERTTREPGALGPNAMVGDFVVTTAQGWRIVVEAKRQASIQLGGRDGILAELDRATANREADAAVCISGRDAFPKETGSFGVYGDRVLAVDEGDGTMLTVALRWTLAQLGASAAAGTTELDVALLSERVGRIRKLADGLKSTRRTLTDVRTSVSNVQESLGDMRSALLELVDDMERELAPR